MPWLGTVVIEEQGHEIVAIRLDGGQILAEFVVQGPFSGLPMGKHHYAVFDWQQNLVWQGALEFDIPALEPGGRYPLEIRLDIESSKHAGDKRSNSIIDASQIVRDERETIEAYLHPSRVAFLGFRHPDGSLSDAGSDLGLPRVYQVG